MTAPATPAHRGAKGRTREGNKAGKERNEREYRESQRDLMRASRETDSSTIGIANSNLD